jgi:hypothetical protein
MTTTERPAQPGERCDCGQPANVVFITEQHGDVPSCGVVHRGDEEPDRIVVIPEITIPATNAATAQRVHDLLDEVAPMLDQLHAAALELREEYHRALIQLHPYLGGGYDEVHELAGRVTGWSEVWTKIMDVIGDRFDPDGGELDHQGLSNEQIAERAAALRA